MKKIAIVLICLIMLLDSIPAFAADSSDQENDMPVVVSLGDSYSAGEGVQPYYGQKSSDKHTCEDWITHRSSSAWPGLLKYNGKYLNTVRAKNPAVLDGLTVDYDSCKDDGSWYFTAVSGAVTKDIISMPYVNEHGETKNSYGQVKKVQKAVLHDVKEYKLNLQIDTVNAVQAKQNIDYITMTIGGNDVGFVDVLTKAVMTAQDPDSTPVVGAVSSISGPIYSNVTVPIVSDMIDMSHLKNKLVEVLESFWDDDSDSYSNRLKKTYDEILKAAPSATLVIAGYPQLLHINDDGTGNGGFFSYEESRLIDSAVLIFNSYLETVVEKMGTKRIVFVDVMSYFEGHEAYADEPYIEGLVYGFDENINFSGANLAISSSSFHPNEEGVYAYASAVQEALAKIDSGFAETYYSTDAELEVYDSNGDLYDNYTVDIKGKEYKNIVGDFDFWGIWKQDYHKTFTITEKQSLALNLPKGNYTITVTDNFDSAKRISKPIKIRSGSKNKQFVIPTNFGYDYVINTSSQLSVYDMNDLLYDNYTVKIDGTYTSSNNTKQSYSNIFTSTKSEPLSISLNEGKYSFLLKDGLDENKTKSFTVRVTTVGSSKLKIYTAFGKKAGQFDKSDVPQNAAEYNGHYYYIYHSDEKSWPDADAFCKSLNGYLVTITDAEEQNFVQQYMQAIKTSLSSEESGSWDKELWIGANDLNFEGDWEWSNGESFSYANWGTNEPDNVGNQDYGAMLTFLSDGSGFRIDEGQWDDTNSANLPFICEWGEYIPEHAEDEEVSKPERETSDERDIVLVLDVSGSMNGTPLTETKKAATKFINTILKEDASIGIVTYDDSAIMLSDFTTNEAALTAITEFIDDGGGTNIESGLQLANNMLSTSNAEKKIIVLMSDGMPNRGREGEDLIAFADTIKETGTYIYTLGFFESVGGSKSSAQYLMEGIASDGCHYEVANADDLVFFFGDIADQINGQKYIYVRIACPVDVTVSYNGESLSSSDRDFNDRTSFGVLTLEDIEGSDDKIKTLRLKEGDDYSIKIEGTGRGKMDYTIGYMDDNGEYSDMRNFRNINITRTTVIDTSTEYSERTVLNVDEDGDGRYDLKFRAGVNGNGELVDYSYIIYIVAGAVGVLAVLIAVAVIRKKIKKRKGCQ